jgi:hypothetical protein
VLGSSGGGGGSSCFPPHLVDLQSAALRDDCGSHSADIVEAGAGVAGSALVAAG